MQTRNIEEVSIQYQMQSDADTIKYLENITKAWGNYDNFKEMFDYGRKQRAQFWKGKINEN